MLHYDILYVWLPVVQIKLLTNLKIFGEGGRLHMDIFHSNGVCMYSTSTSRMPIPIICLQTSQVSKTADLVLLGSHIFSIKWYIGFFLYKILESLSTTVLY